MGASLAGKSVLITGASSGLGFAAACVRAALPELERSTGSIVATGSLMTQVALPTFSSYAAAKHASAAF